MKLYIKNMVCSRCKMVVKAELEKFGFHPTMIELGEVEVAEALNHDEKTKLNNAFQALGFELMDDKKSRLIEKVKKIMIELVHYSDEQLKMNLSDHISKQLNHDYSYLSKLFTEVAGTTIEHYFIGQKIERVKELLLYDELSLNEIAHELNYSSTAHLSKQFKNVTGLTPTSFKKLKEKKRRPIEQL